MPKPIPKKKSRFALPKLKGRFSLFEVAIVVVIVGVAAAIAIPHFLSADPEARDDAVLAQLKTLRSHIESYKSQHKDTLPNLIQYQWNPLTNKSDSDGNATDAEDGFGPYIDTLPANTINHLSNIVDGNYDLTTITADAGFIYDYNEGKGTGLIWATHADKRTKFAN